MTWEITWKADPLARGLADRHYNRRTVGAAQFAPPGRTLVLRARGADGSAALWISLFQDYVSHAWPGAWVCSCFRNEGAGLSSALIREACAITAGEWGDPPRGLGMISFVDETRTRRKRDPGRCFRRAGFVPAYPARTEGGHGRPSLVVLQLMPAAFPPPLHLPVAQLALGF